MDSMHEMKFAGETVGARRATGVSANEAVAGGLPETPPADFP
jgi:hypothetical protein